MSHHSLLPRVGASQFRHLWTGTLGCPGSERLPQPASPSSGAPDPGSSEASRSGLGQPPCWGRWSTARRPGVRGHPPSRLPPPRPHPHSQCGCHSLRQSRYKELGEESKDGLQCPHAPNEDPHRTQERRSCTSSHALRPVPGEQGVPGHCQPLVSRPQDGTIFPRDPGPEERPEACQKERPGPTWGPSCGAKSSNWGLMSNLTGRPTYPEM